MNTNAASGHAKNLANLNRLIQALIAMGNFYNPGYASITVAGLKTLETNANKAQDDVNLYYSIWQDAINQRKAAFDGLDKFASRLYAAFVGSGAQPEAAKDLKALCDQMAAAGKLTKGDAGRTATTQGAGTGQPAQPVRTSTRHIGFDEKTDAFAKAVLLLQGQPAFVPNEADLNLTALQQKLSGLKKANNDVIAAELNIDGARIERNTLFYKEGGLLDLVKQAKAYIKSLQGNGQMYKNISAIRFVRVVPVKKAI